MKSTIAFLLLICCLAECRKIVPPLDKNANINFINMEAGGVRAPPKPTPNAVPSKGTVTHGALEPKPLEAHPQKPVTPAKPPSPTHSPTHAPIQAPTPIKPTPAPQKPQIKPVPVNPPKVSNPITTPGPGSVKQLITFYDSKGQGSPIRPYSYSQAVKQG